MLLDFKTLERNFSPFDSLHRGQEFPRSKSLGVGFHLYPQVCLTFIFVNAPTYLPYFEEDKKYVFVLDKNNKAVSREITTSGEFPDLYVVKSGLTAQDKFLLEGVQNVKEGQKVSYKLQNPKTVISKLRLKAE